MALGTSMAAIYQLTKSQKLAYAEQANPGDSQGQTPPQEGEKSFLAKTMQPDPIEIPRLIQQREADKRREYSERAKVDVKDIMTDREA